MPSREALERQVVLFSLNDLPIFLKYIKFLEPKHFSNSIYGEIYKAQKEYYMQELVLHDKKYLIDTFKEKHKESTIINNLDTEQPAVASKKHILGEIFKIAKKRKVLEGLTSSLDLAEEDDFEVGDIEKIIRESLAISYDTNLGMSIFDFEKRIVRLKKLRDEAVKSFSNNLNNITSGGFYPGELYVYMAPPGVGKSMFLLQEANGSLRNNKKVVYISFELSEIRLGLRFDSLIGQMKTKDIFENKQAISDKYTRIRKACPNGEIIIKEFPTKGASPLDINIFLDQLRIYEDFVPDVIIVDYGDIVASATTKQNDYQEQGEVFQLLRRIAIERQVPVLTATQSTRSMLEKKIDDVNLGQVSDSFMIPRIADGLYALCQTPTQREEGVMYLKSLKNRNGPVNFYCKYVVDYEKMYIRDTEN